MSVLGASTGHNSKWPRVALFGCWASHSALVPDPRRSESLAAAAPALTTTTTRCHKESASFSTHTSSPALENFHHQQRMLQIGVTSVQGHPGQQQWSQLEGQGPVRERPFRITGLGLMFWLYQTKQRFATPRE